MIDYQGRFNEVSKRVKAEAKKFQDNGKKFDTEADRREFERLGDELTVAKEALEAHRGERNHGDTIPGQQNTRSSDGLIVGRAVTNGRDGSSFEVDPREDRGLTKDEPFVVDHTVGELRGLNLGHVCRAMALGPASELERRAMAEGTDSAGGMTVPEVLSGQVIDKMRARSVVIRAGGRTIPLGSDSNIWPKLATDPTASWHTENASITDNSPTFSKVEFQPRYMYSLIRALRRLILTDRNQRRLSRFN